MDKRLLILLFVIITANVFGQNYRVKHVENGFYGSVFSSAYWGDLLVVCSDQKDRIVNSVRDKHGNEPIDLYVMDPNEPDSVKRFDATFRTKYHDGPIAFSGDANMAAVSRNMLSDQKVKKFLRDENHLGIYFSNYQDQQWSTLTPFPFNDTSYNCSHPFLSYHGDKLYFTSNMPGGFGGYDLWTSDFKDGKWTKPVNMGAEINTEKDELFPSFDNGTIYFSSNRGEIGGLDLYMAFPSRSGYYVEVLDTSVNSEYDDFSLISYDGLESGYFSSNRSGKDQLYFLEFEYPTFGPCDSLVRTYLCYHFFEEVTAEIEESPELVYYWNINGEKIRGTEIDYCFPEPGDYEITIDIVDTILNKTYYEQSYYYMQIIVEEQPYISAPDTVLPGEYFRLSAEETNLPDLMIADDDYYWLINGEQKRGKNVVHKFDEVGNYEIQLGVIGYQSEMEIYDCVYRGIVCADTIVLDPLLASNQAPEDDILHSNPENTTMTTEDHKYSDLTDSIIDVFTIEVASSKEPLPEDDWLFKLFEPIGELNMQYMEEEELYVYFYGSFMSASEAHPVWKKMLLQYGLDSAIVRSLDLNEIGDFNLNETFVLNDIQFDSDQWDIKSEAKDELKKILDIMLLFPQLSVNIAAHTDATASDAYNLQLSNRRAKAVRDYLIKNGINADRIVYKGYGESQPKDTNETEEGKQNNRRVEFTLFETK